ncbi:MAG: aminopeptidase P N-terminal domain-containing protein [Bdellovibrionales bacterium]|nr:aminopeptidase P N-terminal domain-containing protein [Bdellovibrionales bacterium]
MLLQSVGPQFKERRQKLMKSHPTAGFILPSAEEVLRNPDVPFPFRQESNFFYLSGFEEPESCLVLAPEGNSFKTILFVRKRDQEREMWDGERYGIDGALKVFGADEAYLISELDQRLPGILKNCEKVYYRMGLNESQDRRMLSALETWRRSQGRSGTGLAPILDPSSAIGEMRLFKRPEEAQIMRKAGHYSAMAHLEAMKQTRPGMNEFEVEALIDYQFRKQGCQRVGYGSIVAGGRNSTCLHYRSNNEVLKDGDLLLIDAGGELDYYTADITRTFPVGKKFTDAQAKAYDLVLKSQKEAIAMTQPGVRMTDIHRRVCEILIEGCLSLGLLKGNAEEILRSNEYQRFYPHRTSHWLGMDVHDLGLYQLNGEPRRLEAGMVFTIEPGFYVQPTDKDAPAAFRNIGIRIEDDILVTDNGCEVLTKDVPKDREEIERIRAAAY